MENSEEILQIIERYTRLKQKDFPRELDEYLRYVAKSGDTVYKWANLKYLFREKLFSVIKNFHDTTPKIDDLPQYPNVDPFNYENMKSGLMERLNLFNAAPFTVQRLCELLIDPRKQYGRIDKFMRALEKNILVVSTIEPGRKCAESENGDSLDSFVNGDISVEVNLDIESESSMDAHAKSSSVIPVRQRVSQSKLHLSSGSSQNINDEGLPTRKKPKLDMQESAAIEEVTKLITECNKDNGILPSQCSKETEAPVIKKLSIANNTESKSTTSTFIKQTNDKAGDITSAGMTCKDGSASELETLKLNLSNQHTLGLCIVSAIGEADHNLEESRAIMECASTSQISSVSHVSDITFNNIKNVDIIKSEPDMVNEVSTLSGIGDKQPVVTTITSFVSEGKDGYDKKKVLSNLSTVEVAECCSKIFNETAANDADALKGTENMHSQKLSTIDQPMEENSDILGSSDELEPASNLDPLRQNSLNSGEIGMNDIIDMATDAIEINNKDEAAGMEVDDTSQEAMDQ